MQTFLSKIISFADEHGMFPGSGYLQGGGQVPGSGLVMACVSGGADSMCLFEALLEISRLRGFGVCAAHYNHMLRGEESGRDEAFTRGYCTAKGVPFYSGSGDVRGHAKKEGMGIEEAARELRYAFFGEAAKEAGASAIATAHTADDNAETMLLNFVRGAGAAGLSGIPPKRGIIIRPMLKTSRDEVMVYIREHKIPFIEDSTNNLDIYTRNKLRHTVMPVLLGINPRFNETAANTAAVLRADEEYLTCAAGDFIGSVKGGGAPDTGSPFLPYNCRNILHGRSLQIEDESENAANTELRVPDPEFSLGAGELLQLPFAVSSRVIRNLCRGKASYGHVMAVLELCGCDSPGASLSLPGMSVYREYGRIVFAAGHGAAPGGFEPVYPEDGSVAAIPGAGLILSCKIITCGDTINKSLTTFLFQCIDLCGRITVRPRLEGDIIKLLGHNCTKSVRKLFIERRVPVRKRSLIPVVADEKGVLAVYGVGAGDRAAPKLGESALQMDFREICRYAE